MYLSFSFWKLSNISASGSVFFSSSLLRSIEQIMYFPSSSRCLLSFRQNSPPRTSAWSGHSLTAKLRTLPFSTTEAMISMLTLPFSSSSPPLLSTRKKSSCFLRWSLGKRKPQRGSGRSQERYSLRQGKKGLKWRSNRYSLRWLALMCRKWHSPQYVRLHLSQDTFRRQVLGISQNVLQATQMIGLMNFRTEGVSDFSMLMQVWATSPLLAALSCCVMRFQKQVARWSRVDHMAAFSEMGPSLARLSSQRKWLNWSSCSCLRSTLLMTASWISQTSPLAIWALIRISRVPLPSLSLMRMILKGSLGSLLFSLSLRMRQITQLSFEVHLQRNRSKILKWMRLRLSRSFLHSSWQKWSAMPMRVSSTRAGMVRRKWMASLSSEQMQEEMALRIQWQYLPTAVCSLGRWRCESSAVNISRASSTSMWQHSCLMCLTLFSKLSCQFFISLKSPFLIWAQRQRGRPEWSLNSFCVFLMSCSGLRMISSSSSTHLVMTRSTEGELTKKMPFSISASLYLGVFLLIFWLMAYLVQALTFSKQSWSSWVSSPLGWRRLCSGRNTSSKMPLNMSLKWSNSWLLRSIMQLMVFMISCVQSPFSFLRNTTYFAWLTLLIRSNSVSPLLSTLGISLRRAIFGSSTLV